MSRRLDDLDPDLRPLAVEFLARCAEAQIGVWVIDTLRTAAEHTANLANGTSWITRSLHLPNTRGKAEAFDVAPVVVLPMKGWAPEHPAWRELGKIGEALGLGWGGRWKRRDMGHFELKRRTMAR